ncbi:exodeoxyribonuclease VII large subunit [Rhodovulum sp. DZ06]|uniref:exodeoxyribonuclease VII large subunit n=1 Tax=Rhodovulum sp. DZ06 TaxID=3425126 RepID=UPI003D332DE8
MIDLFDDDGPEADAPPGNAPEFSVSELSQGVKRVVEGAFSHVRVRGEVGRVSRPRSGHLYLDLKDDRSVLAAVCWKGVAARLEVQPEEGMEVVATGRLTTFPGQSRYQLVIESVAPAGVGALMAMLEKRRQALAAEGLFDASAKRRPPFLPRRIGVVTSPSGAVIRDILHRVSDRFPREVLVWPVAVQGERCKTEVAAAIRGFNALPEGHPLRPDVIIVARGGGSIEDLWGFNEEIVVRAAAESAIPLISAVGHETDTTLIDHAADVRAPTPTAAAEMAVPVRAELLGAVSALEDRRRRAAARMLTDRKGRLRDLSRALPRPQAILAERAQRLDHLSQRLPAALSAFAARRRALAARGPAARFGPALLTGALARRRDRLADRAERMAPALARLSERRRERLGAVSRLLVGYSHKATLARGFAVVRTESGIVVKSAAQAPKGTALRIDLAEGAPLRAVAGDGGAPAGPPPEPAGEAPAEPPVPAPPRPRRKPRAATKKAGPDDPQGSLF